MVLAQMSLEQLFWNQYAHSYDNLEKHFCPYQNLVTEVCDHVDRIGGNKPLRILDAGCGTGNYTWELVKRGHDVIGIDNSQAMLDLAISKRTENRKRPEFIKHDLMKPMPFENGQFDIAICVHVFYTLTEPAILASELRRVINDKGSLVAVTLQKPVSVQGSLVEAYRDGGFPLAFNTFNALFGVGICNLVIAARQKGGNYHNMDEIVFKKFLESIGMSLEHIRTTYTCGISVLAIAKKRCL